MSGGGKAYVEVKEDGIKEVEVAVEAMARVAAMRPS